MNKKIILIILVIVVVGGLTIGSVFLSHKNNDTGVIKTTSPGTVVYKLQVETYTAADVAKHSDASSCWVIIGNSVYDVTAYVNIQLRTKQTVLNLCGKESTKAFQIQYGVSSGVPKELAKLRVGSLAQ